MSMLTPTAAYPTPCPAPEKLGKLLRDELEPTEAGPVEEHVGACPSCQRLLGRLVGSLPDTLAPLAGARERDADEKPPDLPGYVVFGRIAAGGMGVVWRVRDLQFDRDLAVKVMASWACTSPRLIERFLAEAQICGQLSHPSIVPVHTMSRLGDGRPYYTMKLVEGRTLAALLQGEPAPAARRMEFVQIFGQVCQALAFAHSRGVIHRDLKPENVMVGAHGEVQLMDWGLAKVLADTDSNRRSEDGSKSTGNEPEQGQAARTSTGSVLGTLAYMAPEQARGQVEEVDRKSDVFGLGGILCKILTGDPPYTGPNAEMVRLRATEADLGRALSRLHECGADPELIQLAERCLAARKADRPTDAGAVAADVAAYVSGVEERLHQERLRREREQVQAAEERRRRRLWMGLAASVLVAMLLLAGGLAVVNHLRGKEQAAKDLAQKREQETREILDELASKVIVNWLARQPQLSREQREFLKKGLAYYENFTRDTGQTMEGRAALAQAHWRVGLIRKRLGLLPEAEEAFRRSVALVEELAREFPMVPDYQRQVGSKLQALAVTLMERGDYRKAAPLLTKAIRYQQEVVRKDAGDAGARASLANAHLTLGGLQNDLRQWDEAETSLRAALPILKELAAAFPKESDYRQNLAAVHRTRGIVFDARGNDEEAEASVRKALAILKQLVADFPRDTWNRLKLAESYTGLGVTLTKQNRLNEARNAHGEAIAILKPLVADYPSVPLYRQTLASCFNNLAIALEDMGKLDESEATTRQTIAVREKLVHDFPAVVDYAVTLGGTYNNLAGMLRDEGRTADSVEWSEKAVRILEPIVAREVRHGFARQGLRGSYAGRARALDRLGRHAEAARDWDKALALDDGKRRRFYESRRALSQGNASQAVTLAREQAQTKGASSRTLYDCARICGLAAAAVKEDSVLRKRYADYAVDLLRQAIVDYSGTPHPGPRTDEAFDSLRGREEFQQLVKQLEARTPARSPSRK